METEKKPLFELPKLFTLDGKEVTEDRMLSELAGTTCSAGGCNNCNGGGAKPTLE